MSAPQKRFESYSDNDGLFIPANACKRCEKWFPPYMCPVSAEDVGVYCWGHTIEDAVSKATADLESQRDTLRTALIEAQRVLQQFAGKPLENGNLVHNLNLFRLPGSESQLSGPQGEFCDFCGNPWPCATQQARDVLARIRQALEASK